MKFLRKLFYSNKRQKTPKETKEEYWARWEVFELLEDLHAAEKLLANCDGGYSDEFKSAEQFHQALIDEIDEIEHSNVLDYSQLWIWFAPTSVWDDFVGQVGEKLGNRIFERVDKWYQNAMRN